jgi:succinoglycan biosynthesis protein ExoH
VPIPSEAIKKVQADTSRRIAIARYLAIVGILLVHNDYQPLAELGRSAFETTKATLIHGVFRYALPMLTAISGWLLFSARLDQNFGKLVSKKTATLVVPLVIWNLPIAITVYVLQKHDVVSHSFLLQFYPFDLMSWLNGVLSVFHSPVNYPLHFLRDLFAIALLAPVFGYFLRRAPYWGLATVMLVAIFNLDGPLVIRENLMISFYIGGLAAVRNWDLKRLDPYAVPLLASLLACSFIIAIADMEQIDWLRVVAPFWLWPCFSLLEKTRFADWLVRSSKYSFYLFVTHGPLLFVMWKVYPTVSAYLPYPAYWILAGFAVIAFGHVTMRPFMLIAPRFSRMALGNRGDEQLLRASYLQRLMSRLSPWEQVPIGIEQVGLRGPLLHVNHGLCEMLGYSREELERRTFRDITHPDDLASEEKLLEQLITGEINSYSIEKRYLRKDGSPLLVRVTSSQVHHGERGGYRISIIENVARNGEALQAVERMLERRRRTYLAALKYVLPDRWRELNEAIRRAIGETLAYHAQAARTGQAPSCGR